jgi:hypothetical protein
MFNYKKASPLLLLFFAIHCSHVYAAPYVTAQGGAYSAEGFNIGGTGRIGAGYLWDVQPRVKLGVETGFQLYQDIGDSFETDKRKSIDLLGVVETNPIGKMTVFAKAGPAYTMEKSQKKYSEYKSDAFVPKGVIGVGYNLSDKINANVSVNHEFGGKDLSTSSATSVMAGINFKFL